jgi:uncharacterized membrane protein YfcA
MNSYPVIVYVVTVIAGLMIGIAKGGLGGVLGALATPFMSLVLPPEQVVGLVLPMLIVTDLFAVAVHWKKWSTKLVVALLPGAILGVTLGTYFISNTPTGTLRFVLGVIVLILALYKLIEPYVKINRKYETKTWHGILTGTTAGFTSSLAHAGGPPVVIFLLLQDIPPRLFVATLALFFMILNWVKVPYYIVSGLLDFERFWNFAWIILVLPLGVLIGKWANARIDKKTFERVIVVLLIINAFMLILR